MIWVVDEVVAIAVIEALRTIGSAIHIAQIYRCLATGYVLVYDIVGISQSGIYRVVSLEVDQRVVGSNVPVVRYVVANLGVKVRLLEVEVVLGAVSSVVAKAYKDDD